MVEPWKILGLKNQAAKAWEKQYMDTFWVNSWLETKATPRVAKTFMKYNLTVNDLMPWLEVKFTPTEALHWLLRGFNIPSALSLKKALGVKQANAWLKSELPTSSLKTWMISGLDLMYDILLKSAAVSLDTIGPGVKRTLTPDSFWLDENGERTRKGQSPKGNGPHLMPPSNGKGLR